jgi:alpha-ketoglutarate-dependent taurine dioxygenase
LRSQCRPLIPCRPGGVKRGVLVRGARLARVAVHPSPPQRRIVFLYALEVPPEGGDTLFADTYAAFAALPDDVRRVIEGRRACFSRVRLHHVHYPHMAPLTDEQKANRPDVWHPIAREHPRSGWTALYIGRWACEVEGLPEAESSELIRSLQEAATRADFVYRHRWQVGDAVLWDNRCTQHCATEFDETRHRRRMHRTTLEGELPRLARAPRLRPGRVAPSAT